jgi:hypothetical protein
MKSKEEFQQFITKLNVYNITISSKLRDEFSAMYAHIFEQAPPCTGCPGELEQAIHKLKVYEMLLNQTKHTHTVKATKLMKYTMQEGVVVFSNKLNMMVSSFNCTDDIAETLIAESETNASFFTIHVDAGDTFTATHMDSETNIVDESPAAELEPKQAKRKRK